MGTEEEMGLVVINFMDMGQTYKQTTNLQALYFPVEIRFVNVTPNTKYEVTGFSFLR